MNPVFRTVRELSEAVRARQVSPVALAETFLDRLERLGPRYNAVVTLMPERALRQAREAEALFELVRVRYGDRLTPEQLESVRRGVAAIVEQAAALRAVRLGNADEPVQRFVPFRADE